MAENYHMVEIFPTLQGEGFHAGTPFVFARLAGCNLWSGHEQHRQRDADRHGAQCPLFCDTDFRYGKKMPLEAVVFEIMEAARKMGDQRRVVFTGGEPCLTLDYDLLERLQEEEFYIAIETNGTVQPKPRVSEMLDWVCVSPKVPQEKLSWLQADEIKVVYPDYDPQAYADFAKRCQYAYIQPAAAPTAVGKSVLAYDVIQRAAELCMRMPGWKLSLQTHKIIGLP